MVPRGQAGEGVRQVLVSFGSNISYLTSAKFEEYLIQLV